MIVDKFRGTPYKLDCSATPAPNDYMEIGNHCDFLDVLPSNDMLARWFINDLSEAGKYRLKEHGKADFWRWIGTWAVAVNRPSDLGYENGLYDLPPLNIAEHIVEVDNIDGRSDGMLFRLPSMSATSMHAELRRTVEHRVEKAAEIMAGIPAEDQVILWCHTDNEADEVKRQIPDVVEIRGSHPVMRKEKAIEDFQLGQVRILCGKPSMWGHGLNLQCCHHMIYIGLDYSFKGLFQSMRRCWRFGQTSEVNVHIILAETEGRLLDTIRRKEADFDEMNARMVEAVGRYGLGGNRKRRTLLEYNPTVAMKLPTWLKGANP